MWGVNPRRSAVHGLPCFPSLVRPAVGARRGGRRDPRGRGAARSSRRRARLGCGGAVVYGAGFGETVGRGVARAGAEGGGEAVLAAGLRAELRRADLAALARGAVGRRAGGAAAGPRRARLPERQPRGQRARHAARAAAAHRDLERQRGGGHDAGLGRAAGARGGRPVDRAARRVRGRRRAAVRGARRVRRRGGRRRGAEGRRLGGRRAPRRPRTPARWPGDHRVFRALVEEAGAAWAADVHDLLELAKALAVRSARPRGGGLAILTCSGGDSGLGADEAARVGLDLPPLAPARSRRCASGCPTAATVGNPLDYTAMIWGEVETLRDLDPHRRRGPGDRPRARVLRPPAGDHRRVARELGGGRGGHPRRRRGRRCR